MKDADEPTESPATWENVVEGVAKEVFGRLTGNAELAKEGKEETDIAQEVREEYKHEHDHRADGA
jgi:uncharacterized protein YjbJ (UPF0337 family)